MMSRTDIKNELIARMAEYFDDKDNWLEATDMLGTLNNQHWKYMGNTKDWSTDEDVDKLTDYQYELIQEINKEYSHDPREDKLGKTTLEYAKKLKKS